MQVLTLVALIACTAQPLAAEHSSLRLITDDGTITCRPDGTHPIQRPFPGSGASPPPARTHSPDGQRALLVRDGAIYLADAEGKDAVRISPEGLQETGAPAWSPDGTRVAFVARHGDVYQVHVMDRDGGNERQVTDADAAPHGAWQPRFGAGGRLAYIVYRPRVGKPQPADLVVTDGDGRDPRPVARNMDITAFAWSPEGETIAYSTIGKLVFHDVAGGKERVIEYAGIDPRLRGHAAFTLAWRADGGAVACTIGFYGDRQHRGPAMFGDREVFIIPRDGQPVTWFDAGTRVSGIEWISPKME